MANLPPILILNLGPYTIPVYLEREEIADAYGEWRSTSRSIHICRKAATSKELFLDTLFHEAIEAWNDLFDVKMSHTKIQTLGVCLAQMFGPIVRVPYFDRQETDEETLAALHAVEIPMLTAMEG